MKLLLKVKSYLMNSLKFSDLNNMLINFFLMHLKRSFNIDNDFLIIYFQKSHAFPNLFQSLHCVYLRIEMFLRIK